MNKNSKKTHKRWSTADTDALMKSSYGTMTRKEKDVFAKSLGRTRYGCTAKFAKEGGVFGTRKRLPLNKTKFKANVKKTHIKQQTYMTATNSMVNTLINRAKSAIIEGEVVTLYFD